MAHRLQIHSTNPLERLNEEVKRRTDVVGIFPNEAAITRLGCAGEQAVPKSSHQIYVVETRSRNIVDAIETGTAPRPIEVSGDGLWLYANVDDLLDFEVIELKERRVVQGAQPSVPDAEKSAIRHEIGSIVSRAHSIWLTLDQRDARTNSTNDGAVYAFDRSPGRARFIARIPFGRVPYRVTFSPDGKYGYLSNRGDDKVSVVDVATHKEIIKRIFLPKGSGPHTGLGVVVSR